MGEHASFIKRFLEGHNMTYRDGFVSGSIAGLAYTLMATGYIIVFTPQVQRIAWVFLFLVFILTQFLTIYHVARRKSLFGTTGDGFIAGISFMEALIIFVLYGFRL